VRIFADTSGFFALLVKNDDMHDRAKRHFEYFARHRAQLLTSSFVLVETAALLQRRVGLTAIHDFQSKVIPLLEIIWVNGDWYTRAIQRLFALNSRNTSLVDGLSFEIMESREITHAFSFDKHFVENGFAITDFNHLEL
jgi:predicted nucleic acid-binding protein